MRKFSNIATTNFNLYDFLFFLLMFSTFYFTRNTFCRLLQLAFAGVMLAVTIAKNKKTPAPPFFLGFGTFIAYGAANIVFYNVIDHGIAKTMVFSLFLNFIMIFSISQYILLSQNNSKILALFENAVFCAAVLVVLLSRETLTTDRLGTDTEINANMLSMLSVYAFIICLYRIESDKKGKLFFFIKMLLYIFIILLSGSRKGVIMIVAAVFLVSIIGKKKRLFFNLLIATTAAIILYFVLTKIDLFYNVIGYRLEDLFDFLSTGSSKDYSIENRSELIERGLYYINLKPWTGFGYDCFKLVSGIKSSSSQYYLYSHNNYIELLFSGGIFALVLYYLPLLWLLVNILKRAKSNRLLKYMLIIFVVKHLIEYAYVSYYARMDAYIIAVILGVFLVEKDSKENSTESGASKNALTNKTA